MRLPRRRTVLLTTALLLVGVAVGGWVYVRSPAAGRLVARKLEQRLGTNVQIGQLDVGIGSTSVADLRVYEYQAPTGADPVIRVGAVDLDVSAVGAAAGAMPSNVTLRDARVLLRFNKNGDLVTRLPPATASENPTAPAPSPVSPAPATIIPPAAQPVATPAARVPRDWRETFAAIRSGNWASAQAGISTLPAGPLTAVAKAELFTARNSPVVSLGQIQALLAEAPELPKAEQLARMAMTRGATAPP